MLTGHVTLAQCNSFLHITGVKSGVSAGDLDITGTAITVEAVFNRTDTYDPTYQGGDLVSKHRDPSDANYFLRPNAAGIATSTGFKQVTTTCNAELNKTYHVAMVYDGATLKFYRNGVLMNQVTATGTLVTNNWPLRIGMEGDNTSIYPIDFKGYVNEVRVWNVARTQAQIKAYMDKSLPSPASQTGLKAYYVFNSLTNLQGTAAYNGTIVNSASISQTNPACAAPTISCNSFLHITGTHSGVTSGDVDITGNALTVEALFERTEAYDAISQGGDLVSKHQDPSDANYFLRPNAAGITTVNGFVQAVAPCEIELNTVYHVAMVYDGSSLKYYRNGVLMDQEPASGNLVTNNWPLRIGMEGDNTSVYPIDFKGYVNEVRVWNVARTQAQIKTYMETTLPSPATQTGLKAYFTFNSLVNKQGTAAYNGTITNSANINDSTTYCPWMLATSPDSCKCGAFTPAAADSNRVDSLAAFATMSSHVEKIAPENSSVLVFPNPARNEVKIDLQVAQAERLITRLVNVAGQTVAVQRNNLTAGKNTIVLTAPGQLHSGIYIIHLQYGGKTITRKLVVN
jgi:hypothetical protein